MSESHLVKLDFESRCPTGKHKHTHHHMNMGDYHKLEPKCCECRIDNIKQWRGECCFCGGTWLSDSDFRPNYCPKCGEKL